MKTLNIQLEPVIYQYRFEHSNHGFGDTIHPESPHMSELRKTIKHKDFDPSSFTRVLYFKLLVILAYAVMFAALSLAF